MRGKKSFEKQNSLITSKKTHNKLHYFEIINDKLQTVEHTSKSYKTQPPSLISTNHIVHLPAPSADWHLSNS